MYSFSGNAPLKHKALNFSSFCNASGILFSQTGSERTNYPFGFKTQYISFKALFKSSLVKILNKQFWAATSIVLS